MSRNLPQFPNQLERRREEVALQTPILKDILNKNGIGLDAARDEIDRFLSEGLV